MFAETPADLQDRREGGAESMGYLSEGVGYRQTPRPYRAPTSQWALWGGCRVYHRSGVVYIESLPVRLLRSSRVTELEPSALNREWLGPSMSSIVSVPLDGLPWTWLCRDRVDFRACRTMANNG